MRKHTLVNLGLAMALLGAVAGFARAADTSDAWLTTKAKLTLLTTDGVSASAVNVDTVDGKVTIHGKVTSQAEKAKAADAIRKLDGVKEVQNLLQVVPEARQEAVDATDDTIKEAVAATLSVHPELKDVKVVSVNKGVLLLGGKTPTLSDTLKAVEYALAVPGVRRVASEIEAGAN
jgi:hyperosmotically inducible protein